MAKRYYMSFIECTIYTHSSSFNQIFDSGWKVNDILSWMKDTYCIDDDTIIETQVSFINKYKQSNGKD